MANAVTFQTLMDGPRNVIVKCVGILDTSDLATTDFIDPAALNGIQPGADTTLKASALAIKKIQWAVEDGLEVRLWWDATADVLIDDLTGRGCDSYESGQFLQNNAGAGKTGKIQISTEGWASTQIKSFTV